MVRVSETSGQTSASIIYRKLRGEILMGGTWEPGAKLVIDALRDRYKTGVSPIREALNRLSSEGLVEQKDLRGFQVASADAQELEELIRARCLIEGGALRESIAQGNAEWEERIVVAHYRLGRTQMFLDQPEPALNPEWQSRHHAFHRALVSECGSRWLLTYCQQLGEFSGRYVNLAIRSNYPRRDSAAEHLELMKAVLDRDADRAVALLVEHLQETARTVQKLFADSGSA